MRSPSVTYVCVNATTVGSCVHRAEAFSDCIIRYCNIAREFAQKAKA